jgi:hypothetical protein
MVLKPLGSSVDDMKLAVPATFEAPGLVRLQG